jgi:hypothetical protein
VYQVGNKDIEEGNVIKFQSIANSSTNTEGVESDTSSAES